MLYLIRADSAHNSLLSLVLSLLLAAQMVLYRDGSVDGFAKMCAHRELSLDCADQGISLVLLGILTIASTLAVTLADNLTLCALCSIGLVEAMS